MAMSAGRGPRGGHEVFTPSLTRIGKRARPACPQVNLTTSERKHSPRLTVSDGGAI
jgi:hypothetical protein